MLLALSVLGWIAGIVFRQAVSAGTAEVWMMLWVLAFVLGLPALMLLLPAVGSLRARQARSGIVPLAGVKIPGAGQ